MQTKESCPSRPEAGAKKFSRRNFVGAGVAAAAAIPLLPGQGGTESAAEASVVPYKPYQRAAASFNCRMKAALMERISAGIQEDNGDAERFADFSANFSKTLPHDAMGLPNQAAMQSLIRALQSGDFSDFEQIQVGTPGGGPNSKLDSPQCALAFDLEGLDSHATLIPPAPSVASAQTAAEAVEHYWAALLRDIPFTEYATNSLVTQAVADMNKLSFLKSGSPQWPAPVTPLNLFRGQFVAGDGNVLGPYISQFLVQPVFLGTQHLSQQYQTFLPASAGGADFMTSHSEHQLVENGGDSGRKLSFDPVFRFIRSGRDLAAYTHVDALFQAYYIASLILSAIKTPLNPGNPYNGSKTEKPFCSLGGSDALGTLTEMATRALKAAWFHKWIKNLRLRPEEYGALVQVILTNSTPVPQAAKALHPDVPNSAVLPLVHSLYGSYLMPQAFPEGSPTHPSYPTGHGVVGGACITAIKFFFDCSQKIRPLLQAAGRDIGVPASDGLTLDNYTGADGDAMDLNGELNKLAFNVSLGHGVHSGIHFRSSTYWSIVLGEQVALSILRDHARSYNEPFKIAITKFDGTTATITNVHDLSD